MIDFSVGLCYDNSLTEGVSVLIEKEELERLEMTKRRIRSELEQIGTRADKLKDEITADSRYMWEELPQQVRTLEDAIALSSQLNVVVHTESKLDEAALRRGVLEKMIERPYFGRVDFREDGFETEKMYIGLANLIDKSDYSMIVYDWRTPVASLYYQNGIGRTSYDSPDGKIFGEVERLRQYSIEDGELKYAVDADVHIDDDVLLSALRAGSSDHMKTIITTIQREQNSVIRDSANEILLVLGPAGSGKTSIALHRVAYLLYRDRKKIQSKNILIFSPNEIFSGYIAGVIPELGEDEVMTTTFADMIRRYCGVSVTELYEQLEFSATAPDTPENRLRRLGIRLKGSVGFVDSVKRFMDNYVPPFADLTFQGDVILSANVLRNYYTERFSHMKPIDRLGAVYGEIERILQPVKKKFYETHTAELVEEGYAEGDVHVDLKLQRAFQDATGNLLERIRNMTQPNFRELYEKALRQAVTESNVLSDPEKRELLRGMPSVSAGGKVNFEDGIGILLVMTLFGAVPKGRNVKHVVIDEVQDYTPSQHEIFSHVFEGCDMTLLGDTGQLINTGMGIDDGETILKFYHRQASGIRRLTKSYRSTTEIMRVAEAVLAVKTPVEYFERHGDPVEFRTVSTQRDAVDQICALLNEPYSGATAVITKTIADARKIYQRCRGRVNNLILADDDRMAYERGKCVIPLSLSKGMEFDRVILADSSVYGVGEDRLLYVALTRAMHKLIVFGVGRQSTLLETEQTDK